MKKFIYNYEFERQVREYASTERRCIFSYHHTTRATLYGFMYGRRSIVEYTLEPDSEDLAYFYEKYKREVEILEKKENLAEIEACEKRVEELKTKLEKLKENENKN